MFRVLPTPVQFSEESVSIHRVRCGTDGTMFLTEDGTLYACGRYLTPLSFCVSSVLCKFLKTFICFFFKEALLEIFKLRSLRSSLKSTIYPIVSKSSFIILLYYKITALRIAVLVPKLSYFSPAKNNKMHATGPR